METNKDINVVFPSIDYKRGIYVLLDSYNRPSKVISKKVKGAIKIPLYIYEKHKEGYIKEYKNKKWVDFEPTSEYYIQKLKHKIVSSFDSIINNKLSELDYDNKGEVALYASNDKSKWYKEAVELQEFIEDVYTDMYVVLESITEDNYKTYDYTKVLAKYK